MSSPKKTGHFELLGSRLLGSRRLPPIVFTNEFKFRSRPLVSKHPGSWCQLFIWVNFPSLDFWERPLKIPCDLQHGIQVDSLGKALITIRSIFAFPRVFWNKNSLWLCGHYQIALFYLFLAYFIIFYNRKIQLLYATDGFQKLSGIFVNLNIAFPFSNLYSHVIHTTNAIRKQYSIDARLLVNSFVFLMLVLYFFCQCVCSILTVFSVKEKVK